jgi:hypothetical protein
MKDLLGHVTESLLIRGIEQKQGHHHMSETARTHINEGHQQDYKYPIFHKNLEMYEQKHMTLLIKRR